jgi:hypothetical protein
VPAADPEGDNYLKRLAQAVIDKEKKARQSEAEPPISRVPVQTPIPVRTSSTSVPRMQGIPASSQGNPLPSARAPEATWRRDIPVIGADGAYLPGVILYFEDATIGVYKGRVKGKDYDLVYILQTDGRVQAQGIALQSYDTRPIGRLAPTYLDQLSTRLRWERDLVIFHLLDFEDRALVPIVTSTPSSDAVMTPVIPRTSSPADPGPMTRGRRLTIAFSPQQKWDCIYWGTDELGTVVAHRTHEKWSLMHLDLRRFASTMQYGNMASPEEMRLIDAEVGDAH